MVFSVDDNGRRTDTTRTVGSLALILGVLISAVGLVTDNTPVKGYFFYRRG